MGIFVFIGERKNDLIDMMIDCLAESENGRHKDEDDNKESRNKDSDKSSRRMSDNKDGGCGESGDKEEKINKESCNKTFNGRRSDNVGSNHKIMDSKGSKAALDDDIIVSTGISMSIFSLVSYVSNFIYEYFQSVQLGF